MQAKIVKGIVGMEKSSGGSVKISTFLGVDIYFRVDEGKFVATLGSGVGRKEVKGKAIDEVERAIAESVGGATGRVEVMIAPYFYNDVVGFESIKDLSKEKRVVVGAVIDRGKGRGATKTINFRFEEGGSVNVNRRLVRWNEDVVRELAALAEEKRRMVRDLSERAKALYDKLEVVSAEDIFSELVDGKENKPALRVVQNTSK